MRQVRQVLERKGHRIFTISPDAQVLEALKLMAQQHIGALLVMRNEHLLGIMSERDYARKVILQGHASAHTAISEIMSSPPLTIAPGTDILDCMRLCTDRRIRHLPVVEGERVIGVISIGDLVREVIEAQAWQIEQLERYISS